MRCASNLFLLNGHNLFIAQRIDYGEAKEPKYFQSIVNRQKDLTGGTEERKGKKTISRRFQGQG